MDQKKEACAQSKTERRNARRAEKRRANRVYLKCEERGHITHQSVHVVKERYRVEVSPGDTVVLNWSSDEFNCTKCAAEEAAKIAKAAAEEAAIYDRFEAECVKEINRVNHLYRAEQNTQVIVHNVKFLWRRTDAKPSIVLGSTSFIGKVIAVDTVVNAENLEFGITVRVQIAPRAPIHFNNIKPCPPGALEVTGGGLGLKLVNKKFVVDVTDLSRNSSEITLGARCKPERCDEECSRHTLAPHISVFLPSSE